MAQITITIPDSLEELLRSVAEDQGRPLSQLASICLEQGLYEQLEKLNKAEVYRNLIIKRSQKTASKE